MSQAFRTGDGGRIRRDKPLAFAFDGRPYQGFEGDTLASALLANGVHLMGRSFKYHRPRGPLAAGPEEPNALVEVARANGTTTPNLRATTVELYDGLDARSQNRFPSLAFDVGAVNDALAPFLGAGFYYKTFIDPPGAWKKLYEPLIRRAAGLGHAPRGADPDFYANRFAHCDVLVAGGGPAGLAAALAAAQSGARTILADEQHEFGGSLLGLANATIDGQQGAAWADAMAAELRQTPNVTLLPRTTVFGYFQQNFLGLVERVGDHRADPAGTPRERLWQVRAKEVVLATGAIERPLVFPGNDRPGVMLASAARTYLNRFGVQVGRRVALFAAEDSAYEAALDLHRAGAAIVAIADLRADPKGPGIAAARAAGLPVKTGHVVAATAGRLRVSAVSLARIDADGRVVPAETVACDALLMGGGWTPSVHLFSQSRGKLAFDAARQIYVPGASAQRERSAGGAKGTFDLAGILADGIAAGAGAATQAGFSAAAMRAPHAAGDVPGSGGHLGAVPRAANSGAAFVDFQNDVKDGDIENAAAEGFRSIEHVKRYTTTGMATDQGKTSNMNALAVAAKTLGRDIPQVGLTTFRMPYTPVTFGAIAGAARGDLFEPVRRTPVDPWAQANGAVFEDAGAWKRAWYFPRAGEDRHAATARECKTVREVAGLFDASTLGKIDVCGPDAAEFLDRIYATRVGDLAPGACRYALMLDESGFVMDDGIVARLDARRFHVTTTTGGAARALAHMEDYLQTEWPGLQVWLTSTTEQWATIALQGPQARAILAPYAEGIDLSRETFGHMRLREGRVAGAHARVFRVSFTGELGFEVNVPASQGRAVWETLWRAASAQGACAYGTEAMHVLRAEKGYIIVGQETDGTVTPGDLGLGWAVGKTKRDFVGKRSLARPDIVKPDRPQLVGLLTDDPDFVPDEGAQIVPRADPAPGSAAMGHVTSAYASPALGRSLALALVAGGRKLLGSSVYVTTLRGTARATLVAPAFYDKEGVRLDA